MTKRQMISYDVQYTKVAEGFSKRMRISEKNTKLEKYKAAIKELLVGEHPEIVDVKRIRGKRNNYLRIRLGDYRVVVYSH